MTDERPMRLCDICGVSDTDPRHVHGTDDGGTWVRHMDCCREAGCPTGACDEVPDLRGQELLAHITGGT